MVPVKSLAESKSRLVAALSPDARGELALAMLGDVLDALGGAERVDVRAVVTPDDDVAAAAERAGARAIVARAPGLNASLDAAALALARDAGLGARPGDALLVVLGDVAGATARDVDALCASLDGVDGPAVALAASHDGGTAALLRRPPDAIPSRFGAASADAHRAAAAAARVPCLEPRVPSLAIDLDVPGDVDAFVARGADGDDGGARTRALLARARTGSAPA
ncbi:MAG: 2-phospho-L-lactate guanylyltransferase [Myxococcota bacterium]